MTFRSHLRHARRRGARRGAERHARRPGGSQTPLSRPDRAAHGFQPEGIAIGKGPYAYLGSLADGDIYRANLRTGKGRVISQGPGTPSVGLKLDRRGVLYVAGGPSGTARTVNLKTGRVSSYTLTTGPSFINDVVLTRKAAWFTDSQQCQSSTGSRGATRSGPSRA